MGNPRRFTEFLRSRHRLNLWKARMARDHGRIKWAIWSDGDFRKLKGEEQRLFLLALTQPGLSYAGVVPFTLRRWQQLASDSTPAKLRKAVKALCEARYVVVDEDSEELLIRSFVRNDGLLDSPNIVRAFVTDFSAICSPLLRAVVVCEVWRLSSEYPRLGNDRSWSEVLEPWLAETLQGTFREGFTGTLTETHLQTLESVEKETLALTISSARAAPAPAPSIAPRRGGKGSAGAFCEVHFETEPCRGCAADRKAMP